MNSPIPIIVCLDVEPDDRMIDPAQPRPWQGYEATFEYFRGLRSRIAEVTGAPAHFSWFLRMDPQIAQSYGSSSWSVEQHRGLNEEMVSQGDEIGLHCHAFRWQLSSQDWIADHGDLDWVRYCARSSLDSYRNVFGKNCQSFRGGDRFVHEEVLDLLEREGVRFDLTLEPGQEGVPYLTTRENFTGRIPDSRGVPLHPYLPLKADFRIPDPSRKTGLWMIPLSSGELSGVRGWGLNWARRWASGVQWKSPVVILYPAYGPYVFFPVMKQILDSLEKPYLALIIRSDISLKPVLFRNMRKIFDRLLSDPIAKRLVFSTPREAMTQMGYLR